MPIDDAQLDKATNAHITCPATDTVHRALQRWRATPNSFEWWWLIIEHGSQRFTAIRLEDLRQVLENESLGVDMNTALQDLPPRRDNPADWGRPYPGVVTPTVVEQTALSTAQALQTMQDSPGRVLVVLHDGHFRGILSAAERTFAFTDTPLLDMLDSFEAGGEDDTAILPHSPLNDPAPPDD